MGRFKKAIFIGRDHPDTGLGHYRQLADVKRIRLDIYTDTPGADRFLPRYDIAFVSGYLTIMEALAAGVPVLAHYHTAIKKDYLLLTPFAKYIHVFSRVEEADLEFSQKIITAGQKWARTQTWDKVADLYEQLWKR